MPAVSKKQQKFFGIVRAIQKGEMAPTTPETAKAAADMKKGDVKKFASTKHKGLPEKKKIEEDRQIKKIIKQLRKSVKAHDKQADTLEKKIEEEIVTELSKNTLLNYTRQAERGMKSLRAYANLHGRKKEKKKIINREKGMDRAYDKIVKKIDEESNPRIPRKKGQPANSKKHSDLYTDENPKGTIHGLGFKDVATAKKSVSKIRNSSRSHAHKIQAAVAMEQRAREMGKTSEAAVYRKYINSMKKKTKKMNEAANPAQQAAIAISMKKKGIKPKNLKEQISFPVMQQRIRDAKEKRREQQKKSEKLYMDTKKKGVKFYDKKGTGRLKDGKKVYD
mgnify:FL=1|tara:strand:+ start:2177 stop:3181 length:1005 start_codon:yes stop_codon:yes gene_type:complete